MLPEDISQSLAELGEPKFRAGQLFKWLSAGVRSFDEMTNIPKALREKLSERFFLTPPEVLRKQVRSEEHTSELQ